MMAFPAPLEPANFGPRTEAARRKIQDLIDANPNPGPTEKVPPRSEDFDDVWGEFKDVLAEATHGKCGYCESFVVSISYGDVEHFAPKSQISRWILQDPGNPDRSKPRARKPVVLSQRGYWWLAYEWSNYVLSCQVCNQVWKKNLFPLADPEPVLPPTPTDPGTPLLLHPFLDDPIKHLHFDGIGQVSPRSQSERGRATIDACGLDRSALVKARSGHARRAYQRLDELVRELDQSNPDLAQIRKLADELVRDGGPSEPHCGMIRSIVDGKIPWSDLEALVALP